jgi:hypothetical protein
MFTECTISFYLRNITSCQVVTDTSVQRTRHICGIKQPNKGKLVTIYHSTRRNIQKVLSFIKQYKNVSHVPNQTNSKQLNETYIKIPAKRSVGNPHNINFVWFISI